MKRFMMIMFVALLTSPAAVAAEQSAILDVENMTCALCPLTVSTAIKGVAGVKSVNVSMERKTATVVYEDTIAALSDIAGASTHAGYPATARTSQSAAQ